jgi:C4-dicarboxylate-specific signal transduction histidine kinase
VFQHPIGTPHRFLADTTRLRFELSRANLRLQAEIAERQATEAALRQAQKLEVIGQLTGGIVATICTRPLKWWGRDQF